MSYRKSFEYLDKDRRTHWYPWLCSGTKHSRNIRDFLNRTKLGPFWPLVTSQCIGTVQTWLKVEHGGAHPAAFRFFVSPLVADIVGRRSERNPEAKRPYLSKRSTENYSELTTGERVRKKRNSKLGSAGKMNPKHDTRTQIRDIWRQRDRQSW